MNARCAWLIVGLLLTCLSLRAVTTNDLATAEREGRQLAEQLRNARPNANFTNSGKILIIASKKQRRTIQFNSRVVSWIDNDTGGILLAKAYDAEGKLLKEFRPTQFEKINGEWHLQEMEMENVQTGNRTKIEFHFERK